MKYLVYNYNYKKMIRYNYNKYSRCNKKKRI